MRRLFWALALVGLLLLLPFAAAGAGSAVQVLVSGSPVSSDVPPQIIGGRTLVPLRFVAEALGCHVSWDPGTRRVYVNWPQDSSGSAGGTYQNGYNAGKNDGYNEGYQAGYNAGKNDGYNEGYRAGHAAGLGAGGSSPVPPQNSPDESWIGQQWTTSSDELISPLQIEGTMDFISQVKAALKLLRENSMEDYSLVLTRLRKVTLDVNDIVKSGTGGHCDVLTRTHYISNRYSWTAYSLAGSLVHEASHVWLYENGYQYTGEAAEKYCTQKKLDALIKIGAPQYLIDNTRSALANIAVAPWW